MTSGAAVIGAGEPIRERHHRTPLLALLTANAISLAGNNLSGLAIPWFVLITSGSAALTGFVAAGSALATVIAAVVGGMLADRLGHQRLSVISDLLSGLSVAAIPLLYHSVGLPVAALMALVVAGALFDAPGATARGALVPTLAARAGIRLERVNGIAQGMDAGASLAGPVLAGALIVALGPSQVLWFDAATFAVSAALVALLVPVTPASRQARGAQADDLFAGLRFLRADRVLRTILTAATVANFLVGPLFAVILPVYARQHFSTARDLGWLVAGFGAGSLVGAVAFGALGHRLPRRWTLVGGVLAGGLPLWALAAIPALPVGIAALAVMGLTTGPVNALVITLLQERTPERLRGRVFGAVQAVALAAMPLGMLLSGLVIEQIGVRSTLLLIAAGFLITTLTLALHPVTRELGPPPSPVTPGTDLA